MEKKKLKFKDIILKRMCLECMGSGIYLQIPADGYGGYEYKEKKCTYCKGAGWAEKIVTNVYMGVK